MFLGMEVRHLIRAHNEAMKLRNVRGWREPRQTKSGVKTDTTTGALPQLYPVEQDDRLVLVFPPEFEDRVWTLRVMTEKKPKGGPPIPFSRYLRFDDQTEAVRVFHILEKHLGKTAVELAELDVVY